MRKRQVSIATLIASKPKRPEVLFRALSTATSQERTPNQLVLVFDRVWPQPSELTTIRSLLAPLNAVIISNLRSPGAAGTWNTGLQYLFQRNFDGYVAILDDDDEWDTDHLLQCETACQGGEAEVVLSGLRLVKDGVELPREPLSSVCRDDFLAGNPGWQGSNTFAKLHTLMRVNGFTDGMPSTNDRDLAVRLLSLPDLKVAFTHRMTSTWHIDSQEDALSSPGSSQKRDGLTQFLSMHGHLMTPEILANFKSRSRNIFGIELP